jgi:hypothetical protein
MVATFVPVGERDIAAVVHVIVHQAVKDSEKSNVPYSTTTITIFKAYRKMSNGSQNMVEVSSYFYIPFCYIYLGHSQQ